MTTQQTETWTPTEIDQLQKIYPNGSLEEIQQAIPTHTLPGIRWKASQLKIKRIPVKSLDSQTKEYHRERQRKNRIQNKKCSCGRQAFSRILLTQELKCNRCMVAILKESLQQEKVK